MHIEEGDEAVNFPEKGIVRFRRPGLPGVVDCHYLSHYSDHGYTAFSPRMSAYDADLIEGAAHVSRPHWESYLTTNQPSIWAWLQSDAAAVCALPPPVGRGPYTVAELIEARWLGDKAA